MRKQSGVDKTNEPYRHECEVNWLVKKYKTQGADSVKKYLYDVEKARGSASAERLRYDTKEKIKQGNKT